MKVFLLTCSIFLLITVSYSQSPKAPTDKFLFRFSVQIVGADAVNGCTAAVFNRTLYLDGRYEQEDCQNTSTTASGKKIPVKVEKKVDQELVNKFIKFVEESGFLSAAPEYRGKTSAASITGAKSVTTFTYQNKNIEKKVLMVDYDPYDSQIPCFLHRLFTLMPMPTPPQ